MPAPTLPPWLDVLVPFERFQVEVEGRGLHVMTQGEGRPVLMLHGNPSWGFLWRKVALALVGEPLRVIMPDLVGLGFSDKPLDPAQHTLENHARWIGGLLDALGLDEVVLVAQDWGGPVGLLSMAPRPERLAGLVLMNTAVTPPRAGRRLPLFHRASRVPVLGPLAFGRLGLVQRAMFLAQGDRASISGEVARAYRFPLAVRGGGVAPLALARMVPDAPDHPSMAGLERTRELVAGFQGPAALVWGERDPILGRLADRTHRLLPQASLDRTQAGHFLQEEVPFRIAAAIRSVCRAL